ncbi:hypothetical protein DFP72DRAFT_1076817 [Ephemerocybe angulata]|uniref:Uncharacterized protein n=1 Tax=Ephemerocybe angulata TaxID=980116 RepID=A0A8H6HF14_9AGAR|nr:hypothetical protein DFP72DRAFT_1076817 [Tulosesus angulatus]
MASAGYRMGSPSINPLSQGQPVIALLPSSDKDAVLEVFLGEVVTSYSKGNGKNAKHESTIGQLASRISCPEPTSLGTFAISRGQSVSVNGFDYGVLNMCATSTALFTALRSRRGLLSDCIKILKALVAGKDVGPMAFVMAADESESEHDD